MSVKSFNNGESVSFFRKIFLKFISKDIKSDEVMFIGNNRFIKYLLYLIKKFAIAMRDCLAIILVMFVVLFFEYKFNYTIFGLFMFVFIVMCFFGMICLLIAYLAKQSKRKKLYELQKINKRIDDLINPDKMYDKLKIDILQLRINEELIKIVDTEGKLKLMPLIAVLRVKLIEKYGYMIPLVRVLDDTSLPAYEYQFFVREIANEKGIVYPDRLMVQRKDLDLAKNLLPEDAILGINPINGTEVFWIKQEQANNYENIKLSESCKVIVEHLECICIKNADKIITFEYVQKLIDHIDNKVYIDNLIPNLISIADLQKILISIIRKKVSIKDITFILEKLADYVRFSKNLEELADKIAKDLVNEPIAEEINIHK